MIADSWKPAADPAGCLRMMMFLGLMIGMTLMIALDWLHPGDAPVLEGADMLELGEPQDSDELWVVVGCHGDKLPVDWDYTAESAINAQRLLEQQHVEACARMDAWHAANPMPDKSDHTACVAYWEARQKARIVARGTVPVTPGQVDEGRMFVAWRVVRCPQELS